MKITTDADAADTNSLSDEMSPALPSTCDRDFLSFAEQQFQAHHELLVEFSYSRAAGSRDVYLFDSLDSFRAKLKSSPPETLVTIYRTFDLPLRGLVSGEMVRDALQLIDDSCEFLIVYRNPRDNWRRAREYEHVGGWLNSHLIDIGHQNLSDELRSNLGEEVVVGLLPEWRQEYQNTVWAIVPDKSGIVRRGIY